VKPAKSTESSLRRLALASLKTAILDGATWRYENLIAAAVHAGATDADIDQIAHEALQELFACAERPLTTRQLAHATAYHFRPQPAQI
jgi:hypothetical protein